MYDESKSGQGGGASLLDKDSLLLTATSVTFPYVKYNWTIYSWATTANGLRFYGVYYNSEQVFYDYRVPWVKVNGVRYQLASSMLTAGPDLGEYNSGMFLVKSKYNLGTPNVDVTTITRFYGSGTIEPWVLVDTHGASSTIVVPERFDFDLAGSGDDSQQHFSGTAWAYNSYETETADGSFGENASGYQWRTFDTDKSGNSFIYNVEVDVTPYSTDHSIWYHLAYNAYEFSGEPGNYESNQPINTYSSGSADPWTGYDAVNWYVAYYTTSTLVYPGPWLKVKN